METIIHIEQGDTLGALRSLLTRMMDTGTVQAIFTPMEMDDHAVVPGLITNPDLIKHANPFAPVMPINNARAVSAITGKHTPEKLAAVLRPCEIRALVELVKLQQASLENVILIGLDCPGTYEVKDYTEAKKDGKIDLNQFIQAGKSGDPLAIDQLPLRAACQMCDRPTPEQVDIHLHWFGSDLSQEIPVTMKDEVAETLGYNPEQGWNAEANTEIVNKVVTTRHAAREKQLAEIRQEMDKENGMASLFTTCIRCHNCMTACPICYCKTCLFKTAAFDHPPEHYYKLANRKGATRLMGDTLLFHMTRMNHMGASCISCGMCTSACPSDIPVGAIFSAVGGQIQAAFEYVPGRDVNETLPLITFQANEWLTVGEDK
jgi:formate dehydrogenase (coenzyme F420) beta subunit